jgi:hypothetical protein
MWFTEDPWMPMLIFGLMGLFAMAKWGASGRGRALILALVLFVAAGGVFVVEGMIVTPGEQVELNTVQLCQAVQRKDAGALDHFSNTAPALKLMCQAGMELIEISPDMRVTDLQTTLTNQESRAVCHFRVNAGLKVQGFGDVGRQPSRFKLTWAKEGAEWKIIDVVRLHPLKDEELELLARTAG